ncbi:MAG TPA: hypothetical protein VMT23_03620 [Candidatus Binatia bacterium]|nr:hypothetical protein [Candidatus Binatia bacterium]
MDTETWAQVLVIILSITLTIFLIFAIVGAAYLIKLIKQARRIGDHVESAVESVESAASTIERSASPLAFLKIVSNIVDQASKMKGRKK